MQKRLRLLATLLFGIVLSISAQVTTSGISGKVTTGGEEAIGATVTARHQPSGTVYRAVTNALGRFTLQGMRAGGPYSVEISYIGHKPKHYSNLQLRLGESADLSCELEENSELLQEVVVVGRSGLEASRTGAAQSIGLSDIQHMPSISHGIADMMRLNPQLVVSNGGAMSFAGVSNRYNVFQIDGAMNNDVFGLTNAGTNGGQAGTEPVSMETIEQIQVSVAPFDVRQSGFTGGSINAITKSGTNELHGSLYGFGYNESLIGKRYKLANGDYSEAYQDQTEYQIGVTLGGPIVKNKLFFFANYERSNREYPNLYGISGGGSTVDLVQADDILAKVRQLATAQGLSYGASFDAQDIYRKSDKGGVKLDWNISDAHKLSLRWSIVGAKQLNGNSTVRQLNTNDHAYDFKSTTNTLIAELQSRFSPTLANELRASYVGVRDERTSGSAFPSIFVNGVGANSGTVALGNDNNSMANNLKQDIFTLEDNVTWYQGNHTLTFGTHNELYKFSNLYISNLYGAYYFQDYSKFVAYYNGAMAGNPDGTLLQTYNFQQANVGVTGDPMWPAQFKSAQLAFYAQDKWHATDNLLLTLGLRLDIPVSFDKPAENAPFNDYARQKGWNVRTDQRLSSAPMFSPRFGFRWTIGGNRKYVARGGLGIFSGRIPFVWLSNNFSNTGIQFQNYNSVGKAGMQMLLNPYGQQPNAALLSASGSQTVNVFDQDFRFTQNLRMNLGFDFELAGIDWTAEAIYTKTLSDIYYQNMAYELTGQTLADQQATLAWDHRPLLSRTSKGTPFNNIYGLFNTSKGYAYSLSLKGEKKLPFGLDLMASYTFSRAKSLSSGLSSVAQSNWRNNPTYANPNSPELANSAYNVPHQLKASVYYHIDYGRNKMMRTTIGLIYQGHSGSPYNLIYNGDINGDGYAGNDLIYIPTDEQIDRMSFVQAAGDKYTVAQQRANLKQWLAEQKYTKDHRGEYFERFADNLPFEHHFDLHLAQCFHFATGKVKHSLELTADIVNIGNMLNRDWGRTYGSTSVFENYYPLIYAGGGDFKFQQRPDTELFQPNDYLSRWRGQIGLRYTF